MPGSPTASDALSRKRRLDSARPSSPRIDWGAGRTPTSGAIFTRPALSLIDQTIEKLYAEGVRNVGVNAANHLMTN